MAQYNEKFIENLYRKAEAALTAYAVLLKEYPTEVAGTVLEATALETEVLANILAEKVEEFHDMMQPLLEKSKQKK